MARLTVTASTMTTTTTATWLSLVLVLVFVVSVSAQQTYTLDVFDVPQTTISLRTAGVASIFNCSPSKTSTPTLAGGIRKLQLSAPAGTNTGNSVQLGVFIPNGQPTAPNGVQSANNNLKSPTFQVLYRLDGDTALCSLSSLNSQSQNPILRDVNNLNINLQTIGAYAFHFNALGDVVPNQVTVTMYSPTGVWMAQSNPITVVETGQNPTFSLFTLNFSDSTKWTSGSRFTGTVGAIELSWPEPANLQFAINQVQFLIAPTGSIGATVFVDCGCDGYHAGSGDRLEAGVVVKLSIGGTRCTSSTQSQMTSSTGTMVFSNLPGGCTYTLSVSGLNLCSNSPSSQAAQLGGSVNFAIQGTPGQLSIPPSTTVLCGSDTSPTATGAATIAGGTCAGATPSFTDMVTFPRCTAPGGTIQVISRAWSGAGSIQTQTITVADRKEISVSSWQQNVVIPCDASPTSAPSPTFTSCTAVGVAVSTQASNNCTLAGPCTAVTYKATDQCGNTASRTQYVVEDCASIVNCRFICDDDDPANPPTCSISVQAQALMSLFRETRGFEWKSKANWGTGLPCNQTWFGVSCDSNGNVISLSLPGNRLIGAIPSSLSGACALKTIQLHDNSLRGTIPQALASLELESLILNNNRLQSPLPDFLSQLPSIERVDLRNNNFTCSGLPSWCDSYPRGNGACAPCFPQAATSYCCLYTSNSGVSKPLSICTRQYPCPDIVGAEVRFASKTVDCSSCLDG